VTGWPKSGALRLAAFYAAVYGTVGVTVPFLPVWLENRGLTPDAIGIVLGIGLWVRLLTTPIAGRIADRTGRSKRMMVALALFAASAFAAYELGTGLLTFAALSFLANGAYAPIAALGDSLAIRSRVDYGRVRLWGSLAFMVAALGTGRLLDGLPVDIVLWLAVGGVVSVSLTCAPLPAETPRPTAPAAAGLGTRDLLGRRAFLVFLATAASAHAAHAVYYAFGSIHWRASGISDTAIGLLWAEGVLAEVVLFAFGARVTARVRPWALFALAGAAGVVRFSVLGSTTALPLLAAAQLLHGLTFGATHLGAIAFLARRVPEELASTAQALYSVAGTGLALGLATPVAGFLFERWHGGAYVWSAALGAVALVLAVVLRATPDVDIAPARV
jgi:MFS transporter, PPP family, 3-phenylpropionic acid transporter